MLLTIPRTSLTRTLLVGVAVGTLATSVPVQAQKKSLDDRVDRLEKEMQAVQRKVFPGGAGQIVAPDVVPQASPVEQIGSPASTPLADLTARVSAIETQLARLTGQVEENGHRLMLLETNYAKLAAKQAELVAAQQASAQTGEQAAAGAPSGSAPVQAAVPVTVKPGSTASGAKSAMALSAPPKAAAKPVVKAEQARTQAVAAIARPSTGNAALDGYTYGYRLWSAKFYPEAETQLQETVDKYGKDPIASRAQNLLGRAYLDDGKPTIAAQVLYKNYRVNPKGDRAAESLAWAAEALIKLDRLKLACQAYGELDEVFGNSMPASVKDMMIKGRTRAKCSA